MIQLYQCNQINRQQIWITDFSRSKNTDKEYWHAGVWQNIVCGPISSTIKVLN